METPSSLVVGTGGRPLGTERSPANSPHASGELFAREVEEARARSRGTGTRERRLDELEGERRETRRSGFEHERPSADEARPAEATFRPEHAPVVPQPAAGTPAATGTTTFAGVEPAPESSTPTAGPVATEAGASPAAPPTSTHPTLATQLVPSSPALADPRGLASEAPALPGASTTTSEPVELAQILRAASAKGAKSVALPAAAGPDAAVLERAAEILRQIELHASADVKRLTLELEPAELGRLSIQLALRARRVTAIVRAENAGTLEALREREGELRDVLARRGIEADAVRFELGFGGSRSRGHAQAAAAAEETQRRGAPASADPLTTHATPPRARASRLDTYA